MTEIGQRWPCRCRSAVAVSVQVSGGRVGAGRRWPCRCRSAVVALRAPLALFGVASAGGVARVRSSPQRSRQSDHLRHGEMFSRPALGQAACREATRRLDQSPVTASRPHEQVGFLRFSAHPAPATAGLGQWITFPSLGCVLAPRTRCGFQMRSLASQAFSQGSTSSGLARTALLPGW